ncbi:MAG: FAD:protein FMN transferase [Bacteroidaceae bacterium]|nr:FAD:protein FMN transferase [Bacteroidaceae bacterium]
MNGRLNAWKIAFLIFLIIATIFILGKQKPYIANSGTVFGTYYNITYSSDKELHEEIKKTLMQVDNSLSPFNKKSVISAINNNCDTLPDKMFVHVFNLAQEISEKTDGAFDITVAPLVNAWGFGFKKGINPDSAAIDSLRRFIGYKGVALSDGKITKLHPQTMLDCSAIAKGYGCDAVAGALEANGVTNYMVEIGGEVVAKGMNSKGGNWKIGISKPTDNATASNNELHEIVSITGKSLATSGNYRNFRYEGERKLAHTIDPRTGYPVQHSLLSATVIADDCATADAYATAFMVMGLEKAMELCEKTEEIDAYFIYSEENGNLKTKMSKGFARYLKR